MVSISQVLIEVLAVGISFLAIWALHFVIFDFRHVFDTVPGVLSPEFEVKE